MEIDPSSLYILTEPTGVDFSKHQECLQQYGAFVAQEFFSKDQIQDLHRDTTALISLLRSREDMEEISEGHRERFDDGFLELTAANRKNGSIIFDALPRTIAIQRLSLNERIVAMSQQLMNTNLVMSLPLVQTRIDLPQEDMFLFDWHQDFHYMIDSPDALVYWIPMQDVDETNGALEIAVASHQLGILPVNFKEHPQRKGGLVIEFENPAIVDQFQHLKLPARQGDLVVFRSALLHRSSANRSERARWSIQLRHGNFENPEALARGWPRAMYEGGRLEESYPEYVANLNDESYFHWKRR